MEFRLGAEKRTCGPGEAGVIPAGVVHEAWFPEDTEVIDVFSPPREDFYTGQDTYLKKGYRPENPPKYPLTGARRGNQYG